jgi:hypothetical protein
VTQKVRWHTFRGIRYRDLERPVHVAALAVPSRIGADLNVHVRHPM